MNKTLALLAAAGLLVSAPAFAAEEAKTDAKPAAEASKAEPAAGVKKDEKKEEKEVKKEEGASH